MPDWGYVNARLRGMKTRLITAAEYEKMLKAADLRDLAAFVATTGIKPALEAAQIRHEGLEALEAAFKSDFTAACRKVLSMSEGEQKKLIGILLRRWDVFNVKTILRGKHSNTSPVELLRTVVPAGEFDALALQEMASQPGVKEVVDLLATWGSPLAEPLVENLEAYFSDKNLLRLELALDKFQFTRALKETAGPGSNKRLVRELLRSEIDLANIMAKIRLVIDDIDTFVESEEEKTARLKREKEEARKKRARERRRAARPKALSPRRKRESLRERPKPPLPPIQSHFLPGGAQTGDKNLVSLLRCKNMGEILAFLSSSGYGEFISADMRELESIPDIAAFERALEARLIRRSIVLYRRQPIGVAMAISYLWMKYTEFVNLRIISRGKEFNIPESVLRSELVHAF